MIYIRENTQERLIVKSPRTLNRILGISFTFFGALIAYSLLSDPYTVNPAIKIMAVVPGLFAILGILILIRGTEADFLEVDKIQGKVAILIHQKTFGKHETVLLDVADIAETVLGNGTAGGFGDSDMRRSSVRGVDFMLTDGRKVQATLYVSNKKAAEKAFSAVKQAIGR